jgi:hypothetical protein
LSLFKSFIIKTVLNFLLFSKNSFEKNESFQNNIFALNSMQAYLQRNDLQKYVNYKKGALLKTMFDNGFQNIIYKLYALILKGLFSKP